MTIRVYIGTELKTQIPFRVLEHSIRTRTKASVEVTPMIGPAWEYPIQGIKVGTGFSLRRWMIPAHCNWEGRAIYLDADQIVLGDIQELWDKPDTVPAPEDTAAWMSYQTDKFSKEPWPQSSVMTIDCEAAQRSGNWGWDIEKVLTFLRKHPTVGVYADFMHAAWMGPPPVRIGADWNRFNELKPGTKLLHYTKEPDACWYKPNHPHAKIWQKELQRAIQAGAVPKGEFEYALSQWGVKEDWRKMNGLHPHYRDYLKFFPV